MAQKTLNAIVFFTLMFVATAWTQQRESIDVRLTRIEEAIKATNQRIEDSNKRIDDINKRIDDTNQRLEAGFDRQTTWLITTMGFIAAGVSVVVWFARQERPVSQKQYDKLVKQDHEVVEQFNELEREQRNQRRKQDEFAGVVQQQHAAHDHHVNEVTQKLRALEAEIAMLKSPAT